VSPYCCLRCCLGVEGPVLAYVWLKPNEVDGVKDMVRRCRTCGRADLSSRWDSAEDAAADGVWALRWTCRLCHWNTFDLKREPPRLNRALRGGAYRPGRELRRDGRPNDGSPDV